MLTFTSGRRKPRLSQNARNSSSSSDSVRVLPGS